VSGEPLNNSYQKLVAALTEGSFSAMEAIPLGGALRLSNPLAENAFDLEGLDSHQFRIPAPPECASALQASEMVEMYWQALTRDMPFSRWDREATVGAAVADLRAGSHNLSDRHKEATTVQTLFRVPAQGVLDGPYVSQFLLLPVPHGDLLMDQRYQCPIPNQGFGATFSDWLALENGAAPSEQTQFEGSPRYLCTPRALAEYVHRDFTFQAFLSAALILSAFGQDALSDTNPYKWSKAQTGFVTFGVPHVIDFMARGANAALKAAWFQKWLVHRRIRPEEYAARVHSTITGKAKYPVNELILKSSALNLLHFDNGAFFLSQAYPEGCPAHPAYPAGHAAVAGACATMLKAFFSGSFAIPRQVVSDDNGTSLLPFNGSLTAGGELNKLASNMAMARNFAGVHWRSDSVEGIRLGEAVAMGILRDSLGTLPEAFSGFSFTSFDGNPVVIS
jgi:membrane-associated phospholipid phosphatase